MRCLSSACRLFVAFGLIATTASAVEITPQNPAPAALYGTYAPGGDCSRQPQVILDATGLFTMVGGAKVPVTPAEYCVSCVGGFQYEGLEQWVLTVAGGGDVHPAVFRFNADEKIGALLVEDYDGGASGAVRAAITAKSFARCSKP